MASKKTLPAWGILIAGLAATVFFSGHTKERLENTAVNDFAFISDQISIKIRERLQSYELTLRGGAGLFAATSAVDRQQWRTFVEKVDADNLVPGVQGIGFAQLIPHNQLDTHIAAVRAEGFPDYRINPEGDRDFYTAIVYLEPFAGRNLRAFGYDMYSEPVRRQAMAQARDSGRASLSGKVMLVQETDTDIQAGTLMYVPVYHNNAPLDTIEQRRAALTGWVYSPYRMKNLMTGILRDWQNEKGWLVDLHIYDGDNAESESLLFDSVADEHHKAKSPFFQQRLIDFGGRRWLLTFDRHPSALAVDYSESWSEFIGGTAVSLLLFGLLLSLLNTQRRAEDIAAKLTADIRTQKDRLKESELRWKFAIEGSGDGLWDWNVAEGTVFFATRWKEMLGFDDGDIGNSLDEWETRIHPEDKAVVMSAVQDCLDGKTPLYSSEHRVLCKDGSYKWILDRGIVVSRDSNGKPVRMIGTHSDITEQKRLEISLKNSRAELEEAQRIAKVGSWTLNPLTNEVTWSAELYRMMGINPESAPPDFSEHDKLIPKESLDKTAALIAQALENGQPYQVESEFMRPDGSHGWLFSRGEVVRSPESKAIIGLRGITMDITERKQHQLRIEELTNLYAALSACNSAIVRCTDEEALFAEICRVVVDSGGMKMAWIGMVDSATHTVTPVTSYGTGTDYLDGIEISIDADNPHGRGPTGTAIRENRPFWLNDFGNSPITQPWQQKAGQFGWRSSASLPISRNNQAIGALTFYSSQRSWDSKEIRKLLEEMAGDISFALDKLHSETEAKALQSELLEAEQRFRSLVEQSIVGAYIIQDNQIVYANPRALHILGYSDDDDLTGVAPLEMIAAKDSELFATEIKKLERREINKLELVFSAIRKDGATIDVSTNSAIATYDSRPAIIGLLQDMSDRKVAEDQIRRYTKQLEHTFIQTVGLATTLSQMRDPYTAGHEQRVAEIAVAIGREMDLSEDRLEGLRVGGYLHDVGKMSVPVEILTKPTKLSTNEYLLIKEHAQAGYNVLKNVDFPWPVALIALQHHERIDGSGYPQGLKGDEIILEARITAVADVVESMASHRPYRAALGLDKALEEIERGRGTDYDAEVVSACLRLFREKGYVPPGDN